MVQESEVPTKYKSNIVNMMGDFEFLNAYDILNLDNLSWEVATYKVIRLDGYDANHQERGKIKDIIWQLRRNYRDRCRGYGFVIDIDEETVAISSDWDLPNQDNCTLANF